MPSRRRKSLLANWFGRKRREVKGSARTRRVVDDRKKDEKPRKLRDIYALLRGWSKRNDTTPPPSVSNAMAALLKDVSLAAKELDERNATQRITGKRNDTLPDRKGSLTAFVASLIAVPFCLPAVLMFSVCMTQVISTFFSASSSQARYEEAYLNATEAANPEAVELILLKRLSFPDANQSDARSRYTRHLIDSGSYATARRFVRSIPFDGSERSGELQLNAASAISKAGLEDELSKQEYESRLVIAVADPSTADRARALLGRFYRQTGQYRASESILEPIRATEQGCLELALLRHAQGQFSDIPTTLAPYLVRWRERWLAPKSQADIESSAEALILMNQESIVLETLDEPSVPVAPDVADKIRTEAARALIDREFRSGSLRLWNALEEIQRHYNRLPCSEVWIEPILKLSAKGSPTRDKAITERDAIAFSRNCPASFLNSLARKAIRADETEFAEKLLESIRTRFPEDLDCRETLARLLTTKSPRDSQSQANFTKALELVDSVLRVAPDRPGAIEIRGRIREENGQIEGSLEDYRLAVEADPKNPRLHEAIARVSRKSGQEDLARIHEQLARELAVTD